MKLLEVKNEIINRKTAEMLGKEYEVLAESYDSEKNLVYGSLDSGKTISFEGPENCVGEFLKVKVAKVRKSVIYGEIVDKDKLNNFEKKNFVYPIKVSILPEGEKNMKILRQNKQQKQRENNKKQQNN